MFRAIIRTDREYDVAHRSTDKRILIDVVCANQGGMYVLTLMDEYGASGICLLFIVGAECVSISWAYGTERFYENIKEMIGYYPAILFKYCWKFLCPAVCFVSQSTALTYLNKKVKEPVDDYFGLQSSQGRRVR
jgi:SNF family Na+-dependent transporter